MGFPEDSINPHEKLVLDLHPHWWFMAKSVALLVVALVLGSWILISKYDWANFPAGIIMFVAAGWVALRYVQWTNTHFVLTTDRLIYRSGVITRSGVEIPLERVNTIFFSQGIFERLLGLGDLEIESASQDGAQRFNDIRHPSKVQNEIYVQMENNENRKFDRISAPNPANPPGAPAAAAPSIHEQINQLAALRDQGHLTEEEFQAKKTELLGRM
jgi:uncharacterized membrane protein YdbT with pleckstrin-like domain